VHHCTGASPAPPVQSPKTGCERVHHRPPKGGVRCGALILFACLEIVECTAPERPALPTGREMKKKKPAQPDPRTGNELEPAIPDLPAADRDNKSALAEIAASALGPRMQRILQRVAAGSGVRPACEAEGSKSFSDAYAAARRFKIIDLKTSKLIDGQRGVAGLATELLTARLLEAPEKFSGPQLAVVSGIAVDKVLAHDKLGQDDRGGYISALEAMAERFSGSGAGLELKVTLSPAAIKASDIGTTIDVTPTE